MSKVSSETVEQRVARTSAAHRAARATGQVVPTAVTQAAAAAQLELHRQTMGAERFDAARAWGEATLKDRAARWVARQEDKPGGKGRERMFVVSHEQFAEIKATGALSSPPVQDRLPKFGG